MATPSSIGRYEILNRIGHGGMGVLYLGRDPNINRLVAIKLLLHADLQRPEDRERFAREARAGGALSHPNIVTVFDYGEFDGAPFLVMEYIRGETVRELIKRRAPLSLTQKLVLLEQLCGGLAFAHDAGVIHRDIKPANLMVDQLNLLKILDFGIARMADSGMTVGSGPIGTPGYMAPEQIQGRRLDFRVDLFAVGAVAYELLTYEDAFPGETQHTIMHKVLHEQPPPMLSIVPEIGQPLADVVERALQKDPAQRYQDASSLQSALREVREGLTPGRHTPASMTPLPAPRPLASGDDPDSRPASDAARVQKLLERAQADLAAQKFADADSWISRALELQPGLTAALKLRSQVESRRLEVEGRATGRGSVKEACDRAWRFLEAGALDAARRATDDAMALDPADAEVQRLRDSVNAVGEATVTALHRATRGPAMATPDALTVASQPPVIPSPAPPLASPVTPQPPVVVATPAPSASTSPASQKPPASPVTTAAPQRASRRLLWVAAIILLLLGAGAIAMWQRSTQPAPAAITATAPINTAPATATPAAPPDTPATTPATSIDPPVSTVAPPAASAPPASEPPVISPPITTAPAAKPDPRRPDNPANKPAPSIATNAPASVPPPAPTPAPPTTTPAPPPATPSRGAAPASVPVDDKAATSAAPAPRNPDVRGTWTGSYSDSSNVELAIDRQDDTVFFGTLTVVTKAGKAPSVIEIRGRLSDSAVEIRETRVVTLGAAASWNLGVSSGTLQAGGARMSGTGRDDKTAYRWSFSKQTSAETVAVHPAMADMRGTWQGQYSGSDARLVINQQSGAAFSGTLFVTTKSGREASELQVEGKVSDLNVEIREIKVLKLGAAASWNLGTSVGSAKSDGSQMSGVGQDGKSSYRWSFTRR